MHHVHERQTLHYEDCLALKHVLSSSVVFKLSDNWRSDFPEMLISMGFVLVREPNGGGEKRESVMPRVGRQTHTQTNKHTFQTLTRPAGFLCAHTNTHGHKWSNWGVVKEAASLISFRLPHCPAAFTRTSLHCSFLLSLSVHLLHNFLVSWDSCTREPPPPKKRHPMTGILIPAGVIQTEMTEEPAWCDPHNICGDKNL